MEKKAELSGSNDEIVSRGKETNGDLFEIIASIPTLTDQDLARIKSMLLDANPSIVPAISTARSSDAESAIWKLSLPLPHLHEHVPVEEEKTTTTTKKIVPGNTIIDQRYMWVYKNPHSGMTTSLKQIAGQQRYHSANEIALKLGLNVNDEGPEIPDEEWSAIQAKLDANAQVAKRKREEKNLQQNKNNDKKKKLRRR